MAHKSDEQLIDETRNTARFFVENRHISWVAMVAVLVWGLFGYSAMPKRKDPKIPVHVAVASCVWPGAAPDQVEQLVTRAIEETVAESASLRVPLAGMRYAIKSLTLPGLAVVNIQLADDTDNSRAAFDDIAIKLANLDGSLPQGAQPIQFNSDFGQTSTLMLTVASPPEDPVALSIRAESARRAIEETRAQAPAADRENRATLVVAFPRGAPQAMIDRYSRFLRRELEASGIARDIRLVSQPALVGIDAVLVDDDPAAVLSIAQDLAHNRAGAPRFHPDAWQATVIRDPANTLEKLTAVAGPRYTYHDLDRFTTLLSNAITREPSVAKVSRTGVLSRQILLEYSQETLASYGLKPADIKDILSARNVTAGGGVLQLGDSDVRLQPSGEFQRPAQIENVMVTRADAAPVYLRDLVDVVPAYQSPPRFLNHFGRPDTEGAWQRMPAITLSVIMREGQQVANFGKEVDAALEIAGELVPEDLVLARTSDQPLQVEENIDLFMEALYEAVILVVIVALVGFWEWRSALLMALAIPLTLAMTFGMAFTLGVELQQVSIAALIIALGLLVDDPVVAGDAIKRQLAAGRSRLVAAWLGPTRLARAILFATVTNIVAYLPFLLLPGNSGDFIHSLPVVMGCALIASRLVSMTFIPLLGYYLLRAPTKPEPTIEERRTQGFTGFYFRLGSNAIEYRWRWAAGSLVVLLLGVGIARNLDTSFFPEDVQYLSYVDVWLPTEAPLSATDEVLQEAEDIIRKVVAPVKTKAGDPMLVSITSFAGGGSPRFWFSLAPESKQLNYGMLILQLREKDATPELVGPMQNAINAGIPGASISVRQLETNPVGNPIEVEVSARAPWRKGEGEAQIRELRRIARDVEAALRAAPEVGVVQNDWMNEAIRVDLDVDTDRANLAGVTNLDVVTSATSGLSGLPVGTFYEGNEQIPIVARMRSEERPDLSALRNLYVFSNEDRNKVPLLQIASIEYGIETERIVRREHYRAITVAASPIPGQLASVALKSAMPAIQEIIAELPPGYEIRFGGERAKQQTGNRNLSIVLAVSATAIFLALVLQFNHAFKPVLVFSAVPYGAVGALAALWVMGASFGFMAFLGIIALVGVIVSHVIVLFDFIEVNHENGEPLRESLLDAGIVRLRPIAITVGATVLALVPLASSGGPLWQPLCYAQIGGLLLATFIELLLVKVFYAIAVLDLKLVGWDGPVTEADAIAQAPAGIAPK